MTKKTKAELIKRFEIQLAVLDRMIDDNAPNEHHVQSLLEQYRKLAISLAQLRDTSTTN